MPTNPDSSSASTSPLLSDAAEIARFNALAEQWWDADGPMKPLHQINPVRLKWMREQFTLHFSRNQAETSPFSGLSLLDIGCGAGLVCEPMRRMGFSVTGIDLAEASIAAARLHAEQAELVINYQTQPLEKLAEDQSFDVILLLEVVEHVPDVAALLHEAFLRLKPGGILIASTINRTLKSYALAIIGAEYILRWLPRGTHQWQKFVTPAELDQAFRKVGFWPQAPYGMVFNPFFNAWAMKADCDVNYFMAATKENPT